MSSSSEPIAVIGMAGLFPEAPDLERFHLNLAKGQNSVRPLGSARIWFSNLDPNKEYQVGGYLDRIDLFDYEFFGLSLREAEFMDPHHRLTLQLVCAAIENAGYSLWSLRGSNTAILLSAPRSSYSDLVGKLNLLATVGCAPSLLAGRISYTLGFEGSSLVLDTGCSSSLVTVHYACRELRERRADLAIAGGLSVKVLFPPKELFREFAEIMSPDGECRAFDARANGTSDGEGGGVVVLKLLSSALEDRDNIHTVIKGTAINHNGSRSNGLSAPSRAAQIEVILAACTEAGIDPGTIAYIEAHGSGTKLGDLIEVEALQAAFRRYNVGCHNCAISSVKTNIGHLDHAAGIAGLIKAILALKTRSLYPSLHFVEPNPLIDFENSPVYVNNESREWKRQDGVPRRAGVSSFSLTGTNVHVLLEESLGRPQEGTPANFLPVPHLATLSAKTLESLLEYSHRLLDHLQKNQELDLADVLSVMNKGRDDYQYRVAWVVRTREDLLQGLKEVPQRVRNHVLGGPQGGQRLVLLFSGDASFPRRAIEELELAFPVFREAIRYCSRITQDANEGSAIRTLIFQYCLWRLLRALGITENGVIGSGVGNLMVRVAHEGLSIEEALEHAGVERLRGLDQRRLEKIAEQVSTETGLWFLEIGSDGELLRGLSRLAVASALQPVRPILSDHGISSLFQSLAFVYEAGISIDWDQYYRGKRHYRVELPTYPFNLVRCWCLELDVPLEWKPVAIEEASARPHQVKNKVIPQVEERTVPRFTPAESKLADVWREALKSAELSPNSDYFELGGNSITGLEVLDAIERTFGVRITLQNLYDHSTLAKLAAYIEGKAQSEHDQSSGSQRTHTPRLLPIPRDRELPLSFGQESLWYLDQLQPGSPRYNLPVDIHLKGELNVEALRRALEAIVRRHEVLRSSFPAKDGQPRTVIKESVSVELPLIDLSTLEDTDRAQEEAIRIAIGEARRPFNLAEGPLFRFLLVRIGPTQHVLLITMHHMVDDGWTPAILNQELSEFYAAFCEVRRPNVRPLPIQYGDFAAWQRNWLQGEVLSRELGYWVRKLDGFNAVGLPTDRPRPAVLSDRGDVLSFVFPAAHVRKLKALAREERATMFMVIFAAFNVLLYRYTGQNDLVVATPTAGRSLPETRVLLGYFNNMLPLRTDLSGDPSFRDLLGRVRETVLEALEHQDVPFQKIVEGINPARDLSRNPLFQISYVHQNIPRSDYELIGLARGSLNEAILRGLPPGTAKWDLNLGVWDRAGEDELPAVFEYSTDLFDRTTIVRMAKHLEVLLEGIVANPDCPISALPLLTEAERQQLLVEWNATEAAYPQDRCIHELFEAQAERTPDAVAVVFEDQRLTYRELNVKANHLANYLRRLGTRPEAVVALCFERSLDLALGLLGILKAGAAYLPLDPSYPRERMAFMLSDSMARVLLTQERLLERIPTIGIETICIDRDWHEIARANESNPIPVAIPADLAYVIFTSGSTGQPKAVAIEHRQLQNYVSGILARLGDARGASFATVSTLAADLGNTAIFPSLCAGGTLHIVSSERASDPAALADYFRWHSIDVLKIVPSHLAALLTSPQKAQILPRRLLILGGEPSRWDWINKLQQFAPECELLNHYGPTETTVGVLTYRVQRSDSEDHPSDTLPLGRPLPNTRIYILDRDLQPVPIGIPGEIHIGGAGLGRGYLNRADLTAGRFIPDPFTHEPGARMYRTGDLGRYRLDGIIEFIGRADDQVKIRGFRVELGEVAAALKQHPDIKDAAVILRRNSPGEEQMVAYVVPASQAVPGENAVRKLPNNLHIIELNRHETDYSYQEIFERQAYLRHGIHIDKDACVFDVGANIGLFTLFVHHICESARVYAFEPNPVAFEILRRNVAINHCDARLFDFGLSDLSRTAELISYKGFTILSGLYANPQAERAVIEKYLENQHRLGIEEAGRVREEGGDILGERLSYEKYTIHLRTLSEVIDEEGVTSIDLLKINVEKSELDVLRGIRDDHWTRIRQIVLEADLKQNLDEITTLLKSRGYHVVVEQDTLLQDTELHYVYALQEQPTNVRPKAKSSDLSIRPFVVLRSRLLAPEALRDFLRGKLPDYMVPSHFVELRSLPLTPNGKIDRKALPDPEGMPAEGEKIVVAPRDPLEVRLVQIWEDALGIYPVGVKDNFFELGGHSLLAVRLLSRIERSLGMRLPLTTLFQSSDIEGLAMAMRRHTKLGVEGALVAINPRGGRLPLYCVHPSGGSVLCYYNLSKVLGPDQPLYGLQSIAMTGREPPDTTIEAMATRYVSEIRQVQARGPYLLSGWSMGGLVAFEMAQHLCAEGENVALLALFDAQVGFRHPRPPDDAELFMSLITSNRGFWVSSASLTDLEGEQRLMKLFEEARKAKILPPDIDLPQVKKWLEIPRTNVSAMEQYRPKVYPGRIVLFRVSDEDSPEDQREPDLGWCKFAAGGVEIHDLPGRHLSMFSADLTALREKLSSCLSRISTRLNSVEAEA